jgi:hypothetical protein
MITFKLYREFGALNSPPIFDAFQQGVLHTGNRIVESGEDVAVIWSVLWNGRMQGNQQVYEYRKKRNLPTIIIEVGNLIRNQTWRIGLNNVNALGQFGNDRDLDLTRPKKLGVGLKSPKKHRKSEILIAGQHEASLQWQGQPSMQSWVTATVNEIKKFTDRPIKFRPHPRARYGTSYQIKDVAMERPQLLSGTYDSFNFDYSYHCVVNYNAGPGVQSAINGCPVICDESSLAYPVSGKMSEIDNISLPDREDWFLKLCHTEWTTTEIACGEPLVRIIPLLNC